MKTLKRIGALCLAMGCGVCVPLLVWAAIITAFRHIFTEWRVIRAQLLAGNLICSTNIDCPPGYECIGGRCLSKHA